MADLIFTTFLAVLKGWQGGKNMKYASVQTIMWRLRHQMKLAELSEFLDVDVKTIYRWENGISQPSYSNFLKVVGLCNERGIPLE